MHHRESKGTWAAGLGYPRKARRGMTSHPGAAPRRRWALSSICVEGGLPHRSCPRVVGIIGTTYCGSAAGQRSERIFPAAAGLLWFRGPWFLSSGLTHMATFDWSKQITTEKSLKPPLLSELAKF